MYLALKVVHVLAVVLFLGNISLAMVWKLDADRTKDPVVMAHVLRGIVLGDRWVTIPSVIALIASGITMAVLGKLPLLHVDWIWQSMSLLGLSGALYVYPIGPDQRHLLELARTARENGANIDWPVYQSVSRRWLYAGWLAILAPAAAVALMVLKPGL
jgi:uncharacterized membrane protein